jgi:hypothetical protein
MIIGNCGIKKELLCRFRHTCDLHMMLVLSEWSSHTRNSLIIEWHGGNTAYLKLMYGNGMKKNNYCMLCIQFKIIFILWVLIRMSTLYKFYKFLLYWVYTVDIKLAYLRLFYKTIISKIYFIFFRFTEVEFNDLPLLHTHTLYTEIFLF